MRIWLVVVVVVVVFLETFKKGYIIGLWKESTRCGFELRIVTETFNVR